MAKTHHTQDTHRNQPISATPTVDPALDALLRERLAPDGVGVSVAVVQGGRVRHRAGYGLAVREWGITPVPDTVFALGSLTKPFTALAVLRLVAAGHVRLNDPVKRHLPDYDDHGGTITLRHLLMHTSGIPNYVTQPDYWRHASRLDHTPPEVRALFEPRPLDFAPDTRYSYSNSGYFLLALVIEAVTGKPYEDFVRDEVLRQFGMTSATFFDDARIIPRRAFGYRAENDRDGDPSTQPDPGAAFCQASYLSATLLRGNGGLAASLDDLVAFDAALRAGRLLPPDLWAEMTTPTRLADGAERGYGLGWGLSTFRGRRVIHHAGGIPGYSSFYGHFPDDDLSLIVLANLTGFDCADLARALASALASATLELPAQIRAPVTLPEDEMGRMLGHYRNVIGEEVTIERLGDRLVCGDGATSRDVLPVAEGLLQAVDDPDITVRFEGQTDGIYTRAQVTVPFYWHVVERVS